MVDYFALDKEATVILFSLERYLLQKDFELETNIDKKIKKNVWINNWEKGIKDFLKSQIQGEENQLISNYNDIIKKTNELNLENFNKRIILLEVTLFNPYLPTNNEEKEIIRLKMNNKLKESQLIKLAEDIGINQNEINEINDVYNNSSKFYSEKYMKILINLASTLSGRELLYCGVSMTRNIGDRVCGSGMLGCDIGEGSKELAEIITTSFNFTIVQIIKLESSLRYIFVMHENNQEAIKGIIEQATETRNNLITEATKEQIRLANCKSAKNKEEIKKSKNKVEMLKKGIELFEKFIIRNSGL